jgi:uncharacterized protein (DUF362 family)
MKSTVSLVRSEEHYRGVRRSLQPFRKSLARAVADAPAVVIKINMVVTKTPRYAKGAPLAATPVEACRAFADFLRPFYQGKIVIAEEPAWGNARDGFRMYGFAKLAASDPRMELADLRAEAARETSIPLPGGALRLPLSRRLAEAPFLVSIVRPKTHVNVVMTAGIKNVLVGVIQGYANRRKIHGAGRLHHAIAALAEHAYPDFTIVDGTVGMQEGGPVRGTEIRSGWALASHDALAADSLAAHLMGFRLSEVGYLQLIAESGRGLAYPSRGLEILGEAPEVLAKPYKPHRSYRKAREWKAPRP